MVNHVIKLTGSSNHNKCARADVKDPKAWCYTVDPNTRWEECSPRCAGYASSTDATPNVVSVTPIHTNTLSPIHTTTVSPIHEKTVSPIHANTVSPIHEKTGTRFRDIPEQVPTIDPRSKYDQQGNCVKDCEQTGFMKGIEQCGPNQCQKPKPHWARIFNWFTEQTNDNCASSECYNIFGKAFLRLTSITIEAKVIINHFDSAKFLNVLKVVYRQKNIRPLGKSI